MKSLNKYLIQEPSGRIILQQSISKGKNKIPTEKLTSGMYFVRFEKQLKTFKLIKQ